jgi:hypothetical protein
LALEKQLPDLCTSITIITALDASAKNPAQARVRTSPWAHRSVDLRSQEEEEEEGLQGVFKRLRRNGHQLEKGLQMAQRGPSLK